MHAMASGVQVMRSKPSQCPQIVGRPRMHRKGHHRGNLSPAAPPGETCEIVGAHQPDEACRWKSPAQCAQRIDGVAGAEPCLDIGGDDPPPIGDASRRGEAVGEGGHAVGLLERVAGRDHQPDLIEVQPALQLSRNMAMAGMGRVERTAKDADALPPPVAARGNGSAQSGALCINFSATDVPIADHGVAKTRQLLESDRSAGVNAAGGDTDFGTKTKLPAIAELG